MRMSANLTVEVDQVADHRRKKLADALDDAPVDEGGARRVQQLQPQAPVDRLDLDFKVPVARHQRLGIVAVVAAVHHGEGTTTQQVGKIAAAGVVKALNFMPAEGIEHAGRVEPGGDGFRRQFGLPKIWPEETNGGRSRHLHLT